MADGPDTWVLDANVILRYLLRDDEKLARKARAIFRAAEEGSVLLACDPVTLSEAVYVMASVYELPACEISDALLVLLQAPCLAMPDKDRYLLALRLLCASVKHFGDACACAAALTDHGGRLLSFDRKLSQVTGITRAESP